ncbi:hypothetical protein FQR65_LT07035 [Abscondita terminalis]|nr:hypothetical protein FQR65_LT07035 [Abscondita terminalis]
MYRTNLFFVTYFSILIVLVIAQRKPGRCPENVNFPICGMTCSNDMQCLGTNKCCRTNCNGALCLQALPDLPTSAVSHRKPGECPVRLNIPICVMTCPSDLACDGNDKCCRTACGGSVCIQPIMNQEVPQATPPAPTGVCPAKPTGPWVCTSTCGSDNDCRKPQKCCKNRCGALACMKT